MDIKNITKIDWHKRLVRSNDYASSSYSLTPDAHRLLAVAISLICKDDNEFSTYRITVKSLIEYFPSLKNDKNAIARVDKATDSLMWTYIKAKNGWIKKNLIHSCQLTREPNFFYIDIRLDNEMLPFLINVTGYFSAPKLENLRYFKKDQHFKLYSYFYSFLFRGETWEVSIEEIRQLLAIDKNKYEQVGHLKNRLLVPSVKLINEVTDIYVSIREVKQWRKISGFIFQVINKVLAKRAIMSAVKILPPAKQSQWDEGSIAEKYSKWWLNQDEFQKLNIQKWPEYMQQLMTYLEYKARKIEITSAKKYLFGILNKNPDIEDLLTPACLDKAAKVKRTQLEKQNQIVQDEKKQKEREHNQEKKKKVKQYLKNLSATQLQKLQLLFNDSIFSRGLKFGEEAVDFKKPVVKACFYHYVYKNYLDKE